MATSSITRRTGALLAGVVPPGGVPLPQQTVGVGVWLGTPAELRDPAHRTALLALARMRRELRAGHLARAARAALDLDVGALPDDPGTTRTVGVLRAVGAASDQDRAAEQILRESLAMCGPRVPPALLDWLLEPACSLAPDAVERACLGHDPSPGTSARLAVLRIRRAAADLLDAPSPAARAALRECVARAQSTPLHRGLAQWVREVARADDARLPDLIEALGPNLPLTDPRNGGLHEAVTRCFRGLDAPLARRLARLTFSAWSTLRDVRDGTGSPELTSFSAQAAALRQVFETLLGEILLARFLRSDHGRIRHDLLAAVQRGEATLGLGRWHGLLFGRSRRPDALATALRAWFRADDAVAGLREHHALQRDLDELLAIRLHALPHDEEAARVGAQDLLATVARTGFGAATPDAVPEPGRGLVGALCGVGG